DTPLPEPSTEPPAQPLSVVPESEDDVPSASPTASGDKSVTSGPSPARLPDRAAAGQERVAADGDSGLARRGHIGRPDEAEPLERKVAFRVRSWLPYRQSGPLIPRHELIEQLKARLLAGDGPMVLGV